MSTSNPNIPSDRNSTAGIYSAVRNERLNFPPIYVVVGAYRLVTDKNLYVPTWEKCKHGVVRGAVVGLSWAAISFNLQRKFVEIFLRKSPRVAGLADDTLFGYQLPFTITTYATLVFLSDQISAIITFFLSKNLRIARDRAWEHTVRSRGKGPEFWGPYVEEFAVPPIPKKAKGWERLGGSFVGRLIIQKVFLFPLKFYPFVGMVARAYLKAVGTARHLHRRYFEAKKMTSDQISVFVEERKPQYISFGFTASILEGIPLLGLVFSISNRVGAAMWAHDLEKRQHEFAFGQLRPIMPGPSPDTDVRPMVGGWKDPDDSYHAKQM